MSFGIVLVHGYTGSPRDLIPVYEALVQDYTPDMVSLLCLPGHDTSGSPIFDRSAFLKSIDTVVEKYLNKKMKVILLGHSTGGSIVLSYLAEYQCRPHSIILSSVPRKIDGAYLERWTRHSETAKEIPLTQIARMVSSINKVKAIKFDNEWPVLILHGTDDKLVPVKEALSWAREGFSGLTRLVVIPGGEHDLFNGNNGALAVDLVKRCVSDAGAITGETVMKTVESLRQKEEGVKSFLTKSPHSSSHLASCPSGKKLLGLAPRLEAVTENEPVFANIEITTRCNLRCRFCARTTRGKEVTIEENRDMTTEVFRYILGLLPHAYRLTLVGLGEPVLHPQVIDIVREAALQKRRVALVTNGLNLDKELSRELIRVGLNSITFSLDTANQELVSQLRPGSDLVRIVENIKGFMECLDSAPLATSVFTAVSMESVSSLRELAGLVTELGVQAWMLTDINFSENQKHSLWLAPSTERLSFYIKDALSHAFSKKLPVLSVRGLEEFGLDKRARDYLLLPPRILWERSLSHTHCLSPWQTISVGVRGEVSICDCQPEINLGNILNEPLSGIWNGDLMQNHRRRMRTGFPPGACVVCPRF